MSDPLTKDALRYRLDSLVWKLKRDVGGNLPHSPHLARHRFVELIEELEGVADRCID